ncbi:pro-sigmaK processing inhibitor BofA family protein [Hazenella sp. IB182357]|uniref:Pro-sigmaK processing inhibitor BofA family protein n=1 Tax=Polycladospora coralii TaxID=2771432 RepID=A0A926RWW6_9BACL|nr:pro-sigmaK processing inhibitor BofA family protein [Polycladospora coralii]MBD1371941.1 pro-sigmaK processing inhibitor BofA family protein [Polycladospora coralii]
MWMEMKYWVLLGVGGILFFMIISQSYKKPIKWIIYGILYTAVGGIALFLINLVGQYIDLNIPINPITAFITGVLGIPGVLYLIATKILLVG